MAHAQGQCHKDTRKRTLRLDTVKNINIVEGMKMAQAADPCASSTALVMLFG